MKTNKKAFTLIETLITLAIVTIVLALVSTLVVVVARSTESQNYNQNCVLDYQNASKLLNSFSNNYSTLNYQIESVENGESASKIIVTDGINQYVFVFQKSSKVLTADFFDESTSQIEKKSVETKNITNIVLYREDNLVKCEYYFENFPTYTDLVTFGEN